MQSLKTSSGKQNQSLPKRYKQNFYTLRAKAFGRKTNRTSRRLSKTLHSKYRSFVLYCLGSEISYGFVYILMWVSCST